jgi:fructose-bisphosphate aldolase class II
LKFSHAKGISVEVDLSRLWGVEADVQVDEGSTFLTDPKEAVAFVGEAKCDSLAAPIDNSRGPYKFKGKQSLFFEVIAKSSSFFPGHPS